MKKMNRNQLNRANNSIFVSLLSLLPLICANQVLAATASDGVSGKKETSVSTPKSSSKPSTEGLATVSKDADASRLELAKTSESAGDYTKAITECTLLINKHSKISDLALERRAHAYSMQHKFEDAVADLTQVINNTPASETQDVYRKRRNLYFAMHKFDLALADADKVVAMNKNDGDSYFFRSIVNMEKRRYPEAIDDLNTAMRLEPNKNQALFLSCRADALYKNSDFLKAIDDYSAAITACPTDYDYAGRSLSFISRGNIDYALDDKTKLVELDKTKKAAPKVSKSMDVNELWNDDSMVVLSHYLSLEHRQLVTAAKQIGTP
jgi:tetratricopeptide (TPR) repeat protein